MKKQTGHIVAVHNPIDNKISYHWVQTPQEEEALMGRIIGKFETQHYMQNEKPIQELMEKQMKTEQQVAGWAEEENIK